jgi:hypothetical protein
MHDWCEVCGTTHVGDEKCPGDVPATGPEESGWRISVETPTGVEAYGVLVAPSNDKWRARIVTYPNMLWTLPGGRLTLKFVGRTRVEAEQKAVAMIGAHCAERGYVSRDGVIPARIVPDAPSKSVTGPKPVIHIQPAKRKKCRIPARYGTGLPEYVGVAFNVSETGLFLGTSLPLRSGKPIQIDMRLAGDRARLKGVVMWNRRRHEDDRPAGMGIRLTDSPSIYPTFVGRLR